MNDDLLIDLFYEYLSGWTWEEWQAAGSSDREEVVVNALVDYGADIYIDDAYDLFYDWAAGLTPEDFDGALTEKVALQEWRPMNPQSKSQSTQQGGLKTYRVTYYNEGVKKSFVVAASSRASAEQLAWAQVEADSLYVTEE